MLSQNDVEHIQDLINLGKMSVEEGNMQLILSERVRVVRGRLPQDIRKILNKAVKNGQLKHMKKEGHKPEVYYHPNFEYLAIQIRTAEADEINRNLRKLYNFPC